MNKFGHYKLYAAIFVGLAVVITGACAQEAMTRTAAAAGAPEPIDGKMPITKQLNQLKSGTYALEYEHSRVHWAVSHHGFSTFRAVFPMNHGTLDIDASDITKSKLVATIDMTKVDTSIDVFDGRLQGENYFNTEKYPTSTFTSTKIVDNGDQTLVVYGDLTFLGITKPAKMNVNYRQAGYARSPPAGYRIGFDATMVVTRSDFGMSKSTIGDEVSLQIEAEFVAPEAEAAHRAGAH